MTSPPNRIVTVGTSKAAQFQGLALPLAALAITVQGCFFLLSVAHDFHSSASDLAVWLPVSLLLRGVSAAVWCLWSARV